MSEADEKKEQAYKLCWFCNRRFRADRKYEITIHGQVVYVHKACKEDIENGYD